MTLREAIGQLYTTCSNPEKRNRYCIRLPEFHGYWFLNDMNMLTVMTRNGEIKDTPYFEVYSKRNDWMIDLKEDSPGLIAYKIRNKEIDPNAISDGYHTFGELYAHRFALFIALCETMERQAIGEGEESPVWYSKKHSDGTKLDGWLIMGLFKEKGDQITYHLPDTWEPRINHFKQLEKAPEWDEHSSIDVLERLKQLAE